MQPLRRMHFSPLCLSIGGPMRRDLSWGNGLLSAQLQRKRQSVFQQGGYDEEIPYCNETIAIYQILPFGGP